MAHLNIVLHEPEIPANTGNIGRTCVATGTRLHLIKPLGFDISDKAVKRAGLDYWPKLDVTVYESYEDFLERNPGAKIYYATTKGPQTYVDVHYELGDDEEEVEEGGGEGGQEEDGEGVEPVGGEDGEEA